MVRFNTSKLGSFADVSTHHKVKNFQKKIFPLDFQRAISAKKFSAVPHNRVLSRIRIEFKDSNQDWLG